MDSQITVPPRLQNLVEDFKSKKTKIQDASEDLLVELARFRYPQGAEDSYEERNIAEIKEKLGFKNAMQVSRLLNLAKDRGIIRIDIKNVRKTDGKDRVKERYPALKRVQTVASNSDHTALTLALGQRAAEIFDELCETRGSFSVTLGGGRTMKEFVHNLDDKSRSIIVMPMALFTRSAVGEVYDSPYLAMVAHWVSREISQAYVCALPPLPDRDNKKKPVTIPDLVKYCHSLYSGNDQVREVFSRAVDPDVIFFGVADLSEKSSIIYRAYDRIGFSYKRLCSMGGIADMNYTVLTEAGNDLSDEIIKELNIDHDIPKHSHPFLLAMSIKRIKELVGDKQRERDVFVVAGGVHKYKAIKAVLKGRIANCLITDEDTITRLAEDND